MEGLKLPKKRIGIILIGKHSIENWDVWYNIARTYFNEFEFLMTHAAVIGDQFKSGKFSKYPYIKNKLQKSIQENSSISGMSFVQLFEFF